MSFILDALKKAEEARHPAAGSSLGRSPRSPSRAPSRALAVDAWAAPCCSPSTRA